MTAPASVLAPALDYAAAGPSDGLGVALVAAVLGAGYLAVCAIWPYTACRHCHGTGKHRSPSGQNWRRCRHCKATGTRSRLGWRIWAALGGRHDDDP